MGGHRTVGATWRWASRRRFAAVIGVAATLLALAACGTQGYAQALGQPATMVLASAQQAPGSVVFTPFYATHVVVYYKGKELPYADAATPAELRQTTCSGPLIAPLTATTVGPAQASALSAPDPKGGADVAVADSDSLFVAVRAHPNDLSAAYLACGQPLSGRRQYFDLHVPGEGSNGYSLGIALMEPIVATRVQVKLTSPATSALTWAVRSGSCDAAPLAQGQIDSGATGAQGVVFSPLNTGQWRVTLTPSGGGQGTCQAFKSTGA